MPVAPSPSDTRSDSKSDTRSDPKSDKDFDPALPEPATHTDPSTVDWAAQARFAYDVVIVGGGVVGLTCACALRGSGLRVAVIEAQSAQQAAARQRAYAFSPVSAKILAGLGLWQEVGPQLTGFERVRLSDEDYAKTVTFRPEDGQGQAVYYAAEHRVLMEALQRAVAAADTVDYWCETEILSWSAGILQVARGGQAYPLSAALVVGADGARSYVRDRAGIHTFGWKYWQSCITAVLEPASPHRHTAYEKFWPSGPFAILPLPHNRCQIVWTAPHAEAKALLGLPKDQFMAELQQRFGQEMGPLKLVNEPSLFPVQLMHARNYVRPGIALIGDAAHCCHPVGGQGLNMGIRDAAALAEVLTEANRKAEAIASLRVLKRYQRWRRTENWLTLSLTDFLNRAFSNRFLPLLLLRRAGLWIIEGMGPIRRLLLQVMTGFYGRLPQKAR